jgi:hypothetical protein
MADIKEKLTSKFGLVERLKALSGNNLPLPEVGEILTVRSLTDLQPAKSGKSLPPLTVTPIIPDINKERYKQDYDMEEGAEYKFFLPMVGRNLLGNYMRDVKLSLENCLITIEVKEWETERQDVERDLSGKAKSAAIIRVESEPMKENIAIEQTGKSQ